MAPSLAGGHEGPDQRADVLRPWHRDRLPAPGSSTLRSWWNVGFFRGYDQEGLVCGFSETSTPSVRWAPPCRGPDAIGLMAESVLAKGFELPPGQTIRSGRFMFNLAPIPTPHSKAMPRPWADSSTRESSPS